MAMARQLFKPQPLLGLAAKTQQNYHIPTPGTVVLW
jgi:hypothetical protein